ncbi:hypothetical protein JOY44_30070 (plasmid) [Phormidium sp. CLA17]|uniref:hypothetical protein n=1 Tax=Leptolyngbya sp. Cla-17 TaxID=2803751 RepID=UPI00193148BF|nr:hypothetical protein [Leptolyngbya sp. Cla-17]MBM0745667.1 hypothetical protein [Leptolyngbya sp. Cla-17]
MSKVANLPKVARLSASAILSPAPDPYGLLPPANSKQAKTINAISKVIYPSAPLNAEISEPHSPLASVQAHLVESQPNQSRSSTAEAQVTSEPLRTEAEQVQMEQSQPVSRSEGTEPTDREARPRKQPSSDHAAAQSPKQKKKWSIGWLEF